MVDKSVMEAELDAIGNNNIEITNVENVGTDSIDVENDNENDIPISDPAMILNPQVTVDGPNNEPEVVHSSSDITWSESEQIVLSAADPGICNPVDPAEEDEDTIEPIDVNEDKYITRDPKDTLSPFLRLIKFNTLEDLDRYLDPFKEELISWHQLFRLPNAKPVEMLDLQKFILTIFDIIMEAQPQYQEYLMTEAADINNFCDCSLQTLDITNSFTRIKAKKSYWRHLSTINW